MSGIVGWQQYILPKFGISGSGLVLSQIYDNGTNIGVGTGTSLTAKLEILSSIDNVIRLNKTGTNYNYIEYALAGVRKYWTGLDATGLYTIQSDANTAILLAPIWWGVAIGTGSVSSWARLEVAGQVKITGGTPWVGKVLTSDAGGLSTWQMPGIVLCSWTWIFNTCYGSGALFSNTTGDRNTANGTQTLYSNTVGSYNTANGMISLYSNTSGAYNTANGYYALYRNTTGSFNTAVGIESLRNNTLWWGNTANGSYALWNNTLGNQNSAYGDSSLSVNTLWNLNAAYGASSLLANTTGTGNIGVGYRAWNNITTGSKNIAIGYDTAVLSWSLDNQLNIWNWIYGNSGSIGVGVTNPSAKLDIAGSIKITDGSQWTGKILTSNGAGLATWSSSVPASNAWLLTGNSGTNPSTNFIGTIDAQDVVLRANNVEKLRVLQSSANIMLDNDFTVWRGSWSIISNVAVGTSALKRNTTGFRNTAIGIETLSYNTDWAEHTAIGANSQMYMMSSGSEGNTSLGFNALLGSAITPNLNTWQGNIAIGDFALKGDFVWSSITWSYNIAVGNNSLQYISTAMRNIAIWYNSLRNNAWGQDNTMLGYNAGNDLTSGNNNIFIGSNTQPNIGIGASNQLNIGDWIYGSNGNIGIGSASDNPGAKLDIDGQIMVRGGSPWVGKVLISNATGLASWWTSTSIIGWQSNYIARWLTTTTLGTGSIFDNGANVGIGTPSPWAYKLNVNGDTYLSGSLTVLGKLFVDTIVSRSVNNVSISWSLLPDASAPLIYRDIGSSALRWNNLYLSGQVTIAGGTPWLGKILTSDAVGLATWSASFSWNTTATGITGGASGFLSVFGAGGNGIYSSIVFQTGAFIGINDSTPNYTLDVWGTGSFIGFRIPTGAWAWRVLTSDATGNAVWSSSISGSTATGITGWVENYVTKFGTGGVGIYPSQIFDNGTNIGVGTGASLTAKFTIDSGVSNVSGLRLPRVIATTPVFGGVAAPLGVDGSGNVVIAQQGAIPVYTALGGSPNSLPDTTTNPPTIGANYDKYFTINARQSFAVTDVGWNPYNCPEFSLGSINKGSVWCTATPYASYVMTAQNATSGNRYAYQILISDRTDAPFVVRGGMYDGTAGQLMNTARTIEALWFKALTVPTNRANWLYVNPWVDQNNNPIVWWGNIGIGTNNPVSRFEIWNLASWLESNSLMHFRGTNNVWIGSGSVRSALTGNANTGIGHESLFTLTSGYSNTAVGYKALRMNAAGFNNTAIGQEALLTNNGGSWNTALGYHALYWNSSGTGNIAIGGQALYNIATGNQNIAIWFQTLRNAGTSVSNNIAIWSLALNAAATSNLTAIGYNALTANTSGTGNTALGYNSLDTVSTGYNNTGLGYNTLSNATWNQNIAIGANAWSALTSGANNIVIGADKELVSNTASNQLNIGNWIYGSGGVIGIGTWVLATTARLVVDWQIQITWGSPWTGRLLVSSDSTGLASWTNNIGTICASSWVGINNTCYGILSLQNNTTGANNTAYGNEALRNNSGWTSNVALWYGSMFYNTSGSANVALWTYSLNLNTTGTSNIWIWPDALLNNATSSYNIAMGNTALRENRAWIANIAVWWETLKYNMTGSFNSAFGYGAASYMRTTSGNPNNAFWSFALAWGDSSTFANTGYGNTALWYWSMYGTPGTATTWFQNSALGNYSLRTLTSGANNIGVWYAAGSGLTSGSNNIFIWAGVLAASSTASNQLSIGNWIYGSGGNIGIGVSNPTSKLDVGGTFKLGTNGTQLSSIIKASVVLDVPSIATITCSAQILTVTNAQVGWTAMVSPSSALTDRMIIAYARVSAANTVEVKFCNESVAAIDLASMTYYVSVIQ
jgi:trimeric autotransporter adhesin